MKAVSTSYKSLRTEHEYHKLLISTIISRFGDSIDVIAFSWLVYQVTGSPVWLAVLFGVNSIPTILFQPLAGVAVESKNKKIIMVFMDFGRGVCVLLIALLYLFDSLNPWLLMIITFLNSTFEAFRIPAGLAIYPQIISREKYTLAISLNNSVSRIMEIVGMGCAGLIIGGLGIGGAIIIDAVTFLLSAVILCFVRNKAVRTEESGGLDLKRFFQDFREGLGYLRKLPLLFLLCFLNCVINGLLVPINSFQAAYINSTLHLDAVALAVSSTAMSLGLSIGALLYPYICARMRKISVLCMGGLAASVTYLLFTLLAAVTVPQILWLSVIMTFFIFGLSISMIIMTVSVLFMRHTEERYLARVGGIFNSMAMGAIPFVSFGCAAAAGYFSVRAIFTATGILGILFFVILYFNRILRSLQDSVEENGQEKESI